MRDFELPGRSTAYGQQGMAATSHPQSTLAALVQGHQGGTGGEGGEQEIGLGLLAAVGWQAVLGLDLDQPDRPAGAAARILLEQGGHRGVAGAADREHQELQGRIAQLEAAARRGGATDQSFSMS